MELTWCIGCTTHLKLIPIFCDHHHQEARLETIKKRNVRIARWSCLLLARVRTMRLDLIFLVSREEPFSIDNCPIFYKITTALRLQKKRTWTNEFLSQATIILLNQKMREDALSSLMSDSILIVWRKNGKQFTYCWCPRSTRGHRINTDAIFAQI